MEWLRTHPYVSALGIAAVLIIGGGFVVANHSPASSSDSTLTWGGGLTPSYQSVSQQSSPQQIAEDVIQNQGSVTFNPLQPATSSGASSASNSGSFDYLALLEQLSSSPQSSSAQNSEAATGSIASAYQLIPETLIASSTSSGASMTAQQQIFYNYGNEVGGEIQSFEALNTNEAQVIKDQTEDRTDPTKAAAVVSLGQGFASVGQFMQQIQDVPPAAAALNSALAQSYIDVGTKLQLVPKAQSDADFVQAMENYDSSVNTFIKNYGAMAQFFSLQGVVFSSTDPGNVFSFSNTSSGGL